MNHLQVFGMFFLVGGAIGVWGGIEHFIRKRKLVRRAVCVSARIVAIDSEGGTEDGDVTWYYPVVTFTAEEKPVRAKLLRGTSRQDGYTSGDTMQVYFDPLNPKQVVARLRDFPGSGAATILSVVSAAIGAGLLWVDRAQ